MSERGPVGEARPWSADEVSERIPVLVEQVHDALAELKRLGDRSARAKWTYEKRHALAILATRGQLEGRTNKEEREALAVLHRFDDHKTLAENGVEAELARNAYDDQRRVLQALDTELRICQTLLASARQALERR